MDGPEEDQNEVCVDSCLEELEEEIEFVVYIGMLGRVVRNSMSVAHCMVMVVVVRSDHRGCVGVVQLLDWC